MRLIHLADVQSETPLQPMHVVYTLIAEPKDGLVEHHLRKDLGTGWSLVPQGSAALCSGQGRAEPVSLPPFSQWSCSKCNANTPAGKSWLSPHSHGSLTLQEPLGASRENQTGQVCPTPSLRRLQELGQCAATCSGTSEPGMGKYMARLSHLCSLINHSNPEL